EFDVLGGVELLALDGPRGAVRCPAGDAVLPVLAADAGPVGEQLTPAAVGEVVRRLPDELLDDGVTGVPGLAVGQVAAGWGDDVRRIADDQVEPLTADRLVQAAVTYVEVDVVQRRRPTGQLKGSRIDVGGDNLVDAI